MLRHLLREQIKRVEDGLDPMNDALANQKIPTNAWNTILSPARNALREARHGSGHVMDRVDAPGGSFGTKTPCSILICVSGPVPSGGFGTIRPRK